MLILELWKEMQQLREENTRLKAELEKPRKNSQNSSMPPSSDVTGASKGDSPADTTSPPKAPKKKGATVPHHRGGRELLTPTREQHHRITGCSQCGHAFVSDSDCWELHQLVEVAQSLLDVCNYHFQKSTCPNCKKSVVAPHPPEVPKQQQIGPQTDSLLAYLHLHQHIPLERLTQLLDHMTGLKLSEDAILQALNRVEKRVIPYTDQFLSDIKTAAVLGADETSWFINGVKYWAWAFRTDQSTYFVIDKSRAARVPMLTLGRVLTNEEIQFFETESVSPQGGQVVVINRLNAKKREYYLYEVSGTLVADNWTAYSQVVLKQDCLAHLIRHLTYDAAVEVKHGETTCAELCKVLQEAIHLGKTRHGLTDYSATCADIERRFDQLLGRTSVIPSSQTRLRSLHERRPYIFPFLYNEPIPPTNNGTEGDVRKLVVHRKISGGSRSRQGADRTATLSSFIQTAIKRGIDVLPALTQPHLFFSTA